MSEAPEPIQGSGDEEAADEVTGKQKRVVSKITFPYFDLDDAVAIVKAIHNNAGKECTIEQLAGYMKQTTTSSNFKEKVRTSRIFGLTVGTSTVSLTPIALQIVDPQKERTGRAQAFLRVPLYNAMFEKHKTGMLPPDVAIEREMVGLGVAEKQKAKARQAFQRSAQQAGYFEQGKERLVLPAGTPTSQATTPKGSQRTVQRNGGGDGFVPPSGLPPKIKMLLRVLPTDGQEWPEDEQGEWLDAMEDALKASYSPAPEPEATTVGEA